MTADVDYPRLIMVSTDGGGLRGWNHGGVNGVNVVARQALSTVESSFGVVGTIHSGRDLDAWWIWKDQEEVEPTRAVMDRDDLLYVVSGTLRLELKGYDDHLVHAGELFVIPAGTPFRGYRWPRDGDPCLFLAVAPAGASFTRG